MKYILASQSERRKELLSRLITDFSVMPSNFNENSISLDSTMSDYVVSIALGKAKDILSKVEQDSIIISADTIVTINNEILGKPKDPNDAYNMLKKLSGKWHEVYTGLVVIQKSTNKVYKDVTKTRVKFSELSEQDILDYIETKEPLDKAGAYGIQGIGGCFVEQIQGCYYNVVGLSLNKLRNILNQIN